MLVLKYLAYLSLFYLSSSSILVEMISMLIFSLWVSIYSNFLMPSMVRE